MYPSLRPFLFVFSTLVLALTSCGTEVTTGSQPQIDVTVGATTSTTEADAIEEATTTEATYRTPKALADDAGCTPSNPEELPQGRWFAYVYDAGLSSIKIDIACRFTGAQADLAAQEDGERATDGVYIRNDSALLVELEINGGIGIPQLDENDEEITPATQFYPTWYGGVSDGTPVWITLDPTRIRTISPAPGEPAEQ